jgi:hypothetical protein
MKTKPRYETVLQISRVMLDEVEHEIQVRKINGAYHVRCFTNGILNQEARCFSKTDISYTARDLLRTEDKCGNWSYFAMSARERLNRNA